MEQDNLREDPTHLKGATGCRGQRDMPPSGNRPPRLGGRLALCPQHPAKAHARQSQHGGAAEALKVTGHWAEEGRKPRPKEPRGVSQAGLGVVIPLRSSSWSSREGRPPPPPRAAGHCRGGPHLLSREPGPTGLGDDSEARLPTPPSGLLCSHRTAA